ncbi:MAG: hypothetical protein ABI720_09970 [Actinomycetes bacterium]
MDRCLGGAFTAAEEFVPEPARKAAEVTQHSGLHTLHANGQSYSLVQVIKVEQLLVGQRANTPPTVMPDMQAQRHGVSDYQMSLGL